MGGNMNGPYVDWGLKITPTRVNFEQLPEYLYCNH